ncbi:phytoene desaturase family protein [Streptomyces sp. NPDC127066]|uniref:phytoene desaturase family protein n=1 Tax=Streptomyces sp. NPDC127066 TaxID=3347125 RepID=UPI003650B101
MLDAVVIGAGPNGLVAANLLADAGWSVEVLEAQNEPGGAVRSDRGLHPDYVNDMFSAFYPLAAASPVIQSLELQADGLRWSHAPSVLAHPLSDGRCAVLERSKEATAQGLDAFGAGDGVAWSRMCGTWDRIGGNVLDALFTPFPPLKAAARLALRLRGPVGLPLARSLLLPARRLGEEEFRGDAGRLLLAGNALHADLAPEAAGSGGFGWLLCMLGQHHGFPVPAGGAGGLAAALVQRLERHGGTVRCGEPVREVVVRGGRAVGVRTATGEAVPVRRCVLADVSAPDLYGGLVDERYLPSALLQSMRRFQWDFATFKTDWALGGRIPWNAEAAAGAGTVHLSDSVGELTRFAAQLASGTVPDRPFTLLGQMTTADVSRSPRGTESAWAYTHVPQTIVGDAGPDRITGVWDEREREAMADRVERHVEHYAPGFRSLIRARRILAPPNFQALDANLHNGAINGGTASLHQQLIFRPVPGTGRPETPVRALYLASASAHPGGGVHGACGANAARAALRSTTGAARALTSAQRLLSGRLRIQQPRD